ncbi:MAG TPA: formylglycine-generating enzyme family protein [Humisphaera sp.]
MVPIPAGRFRMGSPESEKGRRKDEGPRVEVEVDGFYMSAHEIDWPSFNAFAGQYSAVIRARVGRQEATPPGGADVVTYPTPIYDIEVGPLLERRGGQRAGAPAVGMTRFAARQYTKWLSLKTGHFYRLPTEAEWEYACRAGTTTAYHFGEDAALLPEHAWFEKNSERQDNETGYHDSGSRRPNAWGLYDMHGNAAEWVLDAYDADWYAKLAAKAGGRPVRWDEAIHWPTTKFPGVARGGCYDHEAPACRSAARQRVTVAYQSLDTDIPKSSHWLTEFEIGFRIVRPVREPPVEERARYWDAEDPETAEAIKADKQVHEEVARPK